MVYENKKIDWLLLSHAKKECGILQQRATNLLPDLMAICEFVWLSLY